MWPVREADQLGIQPSVCLLPQIEHGQRNRRFYGKHVVAAPHHDPDGLLIIADVERGGCAHQPEIMCEMADSFAGAVRGQNQVVEQWKGPNGSFGRKAQPQVLHGALLHGAKATPGTRDGGRSQRKNTREQSIKRKWRSL